MTTYNRAQVLPRAIGSVLNQSFQDFELIIVDDGSTDNTKDVLKDIESYYGEKWKFNAYGKGPRIIVYHRKENSADEQKRIGKAVEPTNDGLKRARGKYIAHFDDDDVYWQDRLLIAVKILEENPQLDLIYGDFLWALMKDNKEIYSRACRQEFSKDKLFNKGNMFSGMEAMYRREVYEKVGEWSFDISGGRDKRMGRIGADWDYWKRVCSAGFNIKHIPFIMGVTISKSHPDYLNPNRDFWKDIKEWDTHDDDVTKDCDAGIGRTVCLR